MAYIREKVLFGWVPGPVWTGAQNRAPNRDLISGPSSLYRVAILTELSRPIHIYIYIYIYTHYIYPYTHVISLYLYDVKYTGLFKMVVTILTTCHLVLQMQPHVIYLYGVTSRIRFMFLLFPQISRNWRYESEQSLKPSQLACYKQFRTNSIIVLMFVESQRVYM